MKPSLVDQRANVVGVKEGALRGALALNKWALAKEGNHCQDCWLRALAMQDRSPFAVAIHILAVDSRRHRQVLVPRLGRLQPGASRTSVR